MSKIALLMLLVAPAFAEPKRAKAPENPPRAQVRYDFDDDLVEGGVLSPDGLLVDSRRPSKPSSLIKVRDNFVPELIKSAEDL